MVDILDVFFHRIWYNPFMKIFVYKIQNIRKERKLPQGEVADNHEVWARDKGQEHLNAESVSKLMRYLKLVQYVSSITNIKKCI